MDEWQYRGAKDEDLPLEERLKSTRRETGLIGALSGLAWWALVRAYMRVAHRLKSSDAQQLPDQPGFIIVANHASHLDTLAIAATLPWRWNGHVFPVAAGDTFFDTPKTARFAALCLNALPLWRRRAAGHALKELRQRLEQRQDVLILFPEGTRSRKGALGRFKPGIGRLVAGTAVPVVPAFIEGAHEAFPPHRKWPRPHPIRIRFGPSLNFADQPDERQGWEVIAERLENAVRDLA